MSVSRPGGRYWRRKPGPARGHATQNAASAVCERPGRDATVFSRL